MDARFLVFAVVLILAVITSLILVWHWKTYMPERGKGVDLFTVYAIGLGILLMGLFSAITKL